MTKAMTLPELQEILSEQIRKIDQGETTPAKVNAISNATGKIFMSVRLQMDYHRLSGKPLPEIPLLT
jgi:hypothetical protein